MLRKNQFLIFSLFLSMLYFGVFDLYSQNVGPITISSYKIDDDADAWGDDESKGDGDKVVEQGEKIRLPIVLKNNGTATAMDVKAILKTASTSITVVDSVKDYKMIEAGKEKDIAGTWRDGFHFVVSNSAQSGDAIFTLKITTSNGGSFSDSLTISIKGGGVVGPLETVRFQIDDDVDNWGGGDNSKGDGDKMAEQGERIRFPIVLRNSGTAPALDVKATLRTSQYVSNDCRFREGL